MKVNKFTLVANEGGVATNDTETSPKTRTTTSVQKKGSRLHYIRILWSDTFI